MNAGGAIPTCAMPGWTSLRAGADDPACPPLRNLRFALPFTTQSPSMKQLIITQSFTNRDSAAFERYLSDVEKLPMIDAEREAELSARILSGDRRAIDELVVANLRFGISVAKKYQNLGLPLEDLVAEANAGLIKAAGRFDHTKGFKFISYAVWWVRQSILDALAKKGRVVRVPGNQVATMLKVKSATQHLEQLLERQPEDHEVAEFMDVTLDAVRRARKVEQKPSSLDKPVGDEGDSVPLGQLLVNHDVPSPSAALDQQDLRSELVVALAGLPPRQSDVLRWIFGLDGDPLTLQEVGDRMEVTTERVRQLRDKAIRTMRTSMPLETLRVYLN